MLVLTRRLGESISFPCIGAHIEILAIHGGMVRLGIEAPKDVRIVRAELREKRAPKRRLKAESISSPMRTGGNRDNRE
jgi:carbon storage regulator